ncbi:MAG TPA: arginase family protein [Enhygromyxa sp.]|nr:arginase family protein [Enhygromyxa sp.]
MLPLAPDPATLDPAAVLDELAAYLRPPGQGIHAVSTGKAELEAKTRAYLGPSWSPDRPWREHLEGVVDAKVAMLAIPSDTGAGIVRGAARGPEAIRAALGTAPVLDLGDVFCVPQLLDEAMLSDAQRVRTQDAIWPELPEALRRARPVSPLGMAERVRRLLARVAPDLRLFMLGGDHTVTWPVLAPLLDAPTEDLGIVHFDAHTDLLPERLGITYCFATWAYHANAALSREGQRERMIQIGIRASGKPRAHWERTLGVRQVWADEARSLSPEALAELVVTHLRARGVTRVYLTNDIDGTDARFAAACGTPEPDGLTPEQVCAVISAIGQAFDVVGADLVEVAPGLSLDAQASARTVETAFSYVYATLTALEGAGGLKPSGLEGRPRSGPDAKRLGSV